MKMKVRKLQDATIVAPYTPAMFRRDFPNTSVPKTVWHDIDLTGYGIHDAEPPVSTPGNIFQVKATRTAEEYAPGQFRITYSTEALSQPEIDSRVASYTRRIKAYGKTLVRDALGEGIIDTLKAQATASAAWLKANGQNVPAQLEAIAGNATTTLISTAAPAYKAISDIQAEFEADPVAFFDTYGRDIGSHPDWP